MTLLRPLLTITLSMTAAFALNAAAHADDGYDSRTPYQEVQPFADLSLVGVSGTTYAYNFQFSNVPAHHVRVIENVSCGASSPIKLAMSSVLYFGDPISVGTTPPPANATFIDLPAVQGVEFAGSYIANFTVKTLFFVKAPMAPLMYLYGTGGVTPSLTCTLTGYEMKGT